MEYKRPIIAITGGIASGKSTITKLFNDLGNCEVICADEVSRKVMQPGRPAYFALVEAFGDYILMKPNHNLLRTENKLKAYPPIDRKKLRNLVFGSSERAQRNLHLLESIVHPFIQEYTNELFMSSNKDYILWDVPLLYEKGLYDQADQVIVIRCSRRTRIQRALERDESLSLKTVCDIIDSQASDFERESIARYIIVNDDNVTLNELSDKVFRLNQMIMETIISHNHKESFRKGNLLDRRRKMYNSNRHKEHKEEDVITLLRQEG